MTGWKQDNTKGKSIVIESSCPKLTPTPTMVRTGTRTPGEVDGAEAPTLAVAAAIAVTIARKKLIAKFSFKGKIKDGPIFELTSTETVHRLSQFKKLYDALPVFCADKKLWRPQ